MAILQEEVSVKRMKHENEVMFKDLTGLDEIQIAYVKAKRARILASMIGGSQSGNDNDNV